MSEQPNISQILAALAAQRPGGTPTQSQPPPRQAPPQQPPPQAYPPPYPPAGPPPGAPPGATPYALPKPSNSGSIDISNVKPVHSGSVSLADAVTRARSIAAEKGVSQIGMRGGSTPSRDSDPRSAGRYYRPSRSRSRSPGRMPRDGFRDGHNPYRDERRDEPRRQIALQYGRERSFSPGFGGPNPGSRFTPPPGRGFGGSGRAGDEGVETIPIESNLVGLIIGRQGENLRRVEADTSTRVQFITGPEESGPMRQCKITGSRAARENAKLEIFRIIEENGNGPSASGRAPPPPDRNMNVGGGISKITGAQQPALRPGEDTSQIMVPNRTVGLIIGRGGETIRDLQERSTCHVNIVGEEKSVNGLRPVNLIGTPQAAAMAKDLIMEIVESDTKSLAAKSGDPRDRNGPPAFGGGDGEKINDRISVPSEAVGMIIGKGGETIKDMQSTTGCKINVSPAAGQDFEREIGLVGSRDSIERAKNAIMEKVHAVQEKNSGRGRPSDHQSQYNNDTHFSPPQQPYQQPYGNQQNPQQQQPGGPGGGADPYAAYGGYENYVALWYSSYQAQNQGQQNSQAQGPPGS